MFSTEEKAIDFATGHEKDVADYGVRFGAITAEARRAFDFYRDARADLLTDGVAVPTFEALVSDAVAGLRLAHEDSQRNQKTVAEAVEEFLAYKKPRIGTRHAEGLAGQLRRFALKFGTDPLDKMTAAEIEAWVCSLRSPRADKDGSFPLLGPTTRNKMRKVIKSLFAYGCAPTRSWCHRNPMNDIEPEKTQPPEPEAYTPEQTAAIMATALAMNSPALPCVALGFFAGLRPSEAMALDLSVINFDADGFRTPSLHPDGQKTKTGARVAPLTPTCKAWLGAQTRRKGLAWTGSRQEFSIEMRAILEAAGVAGIYDGARHSFITYRCAEIRDVARVADECGNSPNIIKKHYREIVTTEEATKFFAIRPGEKSGITNIAEGRKSA